VIGGLAKLKLKLPGSKATVESDWGPGKIEIEAAWLKSICKNDFERRV
jgi:hypothetical protein